MTYASQVQDVLIPYTTREDTYHYYEERNYVNDINREYTEVLQTYDHDLKARETYTYGNGRASYLDNQEDTNYNYLTNQSGSVTGLTQDGEVVASSTYHLYGSTKETTDTTGNPYAYNGEARDVTGLDYLRARYYDSQAGTFLTEDSYPGELTTPLTQNGYAYVSNNPVNYTDPSGHFFKKLLKGAGKLLTKAKNAVVNFAKNTARAVVNVAKKAYNIGRNIVNTVVNTAKGVVNWAGTQINNAKNWAVQQRNNYHSAPSYQASSGGYGGGYHSPSSSHAYAQQQQAQARAQAEQRRQQHIRDEYSQSTGIKTTPKTREAKSMFRNWGKALKEMYTHVCKTAKRVKKQVANYVKKIDWKKVAIATVSTVAAVAVTVATAGAAAPVIAGMVGTAGLSGLGAAVVTGVAVGAVSGAAGGAVNAFTTSVLSGDKPVTILKNTFTGMVNGAVTGGATGGLLGVAGSATSSVANPVARHVVDTAGETVVDTIVDASQGGQVTPASIATSLTINALSEGIPTRGAKGAKADVNTSKPNAGDVPVTKSRQESTPVQQLSKPGPTKKFTSGTDFDNFNSSYKDRLNQAPKNGGTWTGTRGESKFISSDDNVNGILLKYNQDGITYKNAVPDFSSVAEHQVEIPNMTTNRAKNFGAADSQLAPDLGGTKADIRNYRKDNGLTWHELNDMTTMQLVPTDVNAKFGHLGGVSEVRQGMMVKP
ncbi:hypothetical protein HO415_10720 [Streptococcus suis]|nr:hypothetical protein [Streptococcus suis]